MNVDERLRQLIEAEKAVMVPSRTRATGWKRLATAITLGTPAMAIAKVSIPIATASMLAEGAAIAIVVGALGTGAIVATMPNHTDRGHVAPAVSAVKVATVRSTSSAQASAATPPATSSSELPREQPVEPPRGESGELPAKVSGAVARELPREPSAQLARESARPSPSAQPSANLDAELQVITAAKAALDRGQPRHAEALLDEHLARFPNGVLSAERDGLRVLLACGNAATEDARAKAERYASRYPGSPLLDRIQRACVKVTPGEISK